MWFCEVNLNKVFCNSFFLLMLLPSAYPLSRLGRLPHKLRMFSFPPAGKADQTKRYFGPCCLLFLASLFQTRGPLCYWLIALPFTHILLLFLFSWFFSKGTVTHSSIIVKPVQTFLVVNMTRVGAHSSNWFYIESSMMNKLICVMQLLQRTSM